MKVYNYTGSGLDLLINGTHPTKMVNLTGLSNDDTNDAWNLFGNGGSAAEDSEHNILFNIENKEYLGKVKFDGYNSGNSLFVLLERDDFDDDLFTEGQNLVIESGQDLLDGVTRPTIIHDESLCKFPTIESLSLTSTNLVAYRQIAMHRSTKHRQVSFFFFIFAPGS